MFIGGVAFDKIVVAMAYHGSRTYPWDRFDRNVGPLWVFERIEWWIAVGGTLLGIVALLDPFRKRWAAWLALGCSGLMMFAQRDSLNDDRWFGIALLVSSALAVNQVIQWHQSHKKPAYAVQVD